MGVVLNDEQCDRFFDTMDALLYYVNDRFRVVQELTLDFAGPIDDMKASLVARTLWDNVEIIDDFVRENPARLPVRCLEVAVGWKSALPGLYTMVRYQGGRALMMGEAGVFSVCGVTDELEGQIGPAPAYVEMVLLPFDDLVVYDGFLQAYDTGGLQSELVHIQDEFEDRCAQGIVATASEFKRVAGAYLEAARDNELEALLADVAREAERVEEMLPAGFHRGVLAGLSALERAEVVESVAGERARRRAGVTGLPDTPSGAVPVSRNSQRGERDAFTIRAEQALTCAVACVLSCGVVSVDDAYAQYRALVADPVDRAQFETLLRDEAAYADSDFDLWAYRARDYLVHYTLTPDFVAQEFARSERGAFPELMRNRETGEVSVDLTAHAVGQRSGELLRELDYVEQMKRDLVESRTSVPMKPLSRTLLENDVLDEVLGNASVMQLRSFLDERVPDGQDDYTFADYAVEEIALASIEAGSLESVLSYVHELGLDGCSADEDRLVALVTNVFNAMPSWENNGWSPQELYEQLTGRKVFYNDDGSVKKVGADDPCPCGSGRKYRECCGR